MPPDQEPRQSGAIVLDTLRSMREVVGEPEVRSSMERLDAEARLFFAGLTTLTWVPASMVEHLFDVVASSTGRARDALQDEVGRRGVERTLNTLWRVILRVTTDNALVSRTPLLFSKTYDRGALTSRLVRAGSAEIVLAGWPDVPDFHARGVAIGIETVLKCAGRKGARVTWARRVSGVTYQASWEP